MGLLEVRRPGPGGPTRSTRGRCAIREREPGRAAGAGPLRRLLRRGSASPPVATLELARSADASLRLRLGGAWRLATGIPRAEAVVRELARAPPPAVAIDGSALGAWDSALVAFVAAILDGCRARAVPVEVHGLPAEVGRLVAIAQEQPPPGPPEPPEPRGVERIGAQALRRHERMRDAVGFVGEAALGLGRLAAGRARFRPQDLWLLVQQSGAEALPIVVLVNFLVGIILGFVGITQLRFFGAEGFVADIVGIAVVRDMGALITGVVLAGRSGGAFAAQLASMKATQELDALRTLGVPPADFLVVPRVVALTAMTPLLTLFADAAGILGGAVVGTTMLSQAFAGYVRQTAASLAVGDLVGGLVKGATYGLLIALAATLRGTEAGRSATGVGDAATQAVVTGIVAIIAACGVYQYVFFLFGW